MKIVKKSPVPRVREKTAEYRHSARGADGRFLSGRSGLPTECRHVSHGLRAMQRAMGELCDSDDWLEALGPLGEAVRDWQKDLVNDLGGEDAISAQQRVVINTASKTMVLLASVDDYLLRTSFIDRRKKRLRPIVQQRMAMADGLSRAMSLLGLDKKTPPAVDLKSYLEAKAQGTES